MRSHNSARALVLAVVGSCCVFSNSTVRAASWTFLSGGDGSGSWTTSSNWNGTIPNASDAVADFSTLDITANSTITLDGNQTVGTLNFADTTPSNNWIINPGTPGTSTLTLQTSTGGPVINVANSTAIPTPSASSSPAFVAQTATINAIVAGNQGLTKTGIGTLALTAQNTYTGTTSVKDGTLVLDYSAPGAPTGSNTILTTSSSLSLGSGLAVLNGGGTLNVVGASGATNSQGFSGTTVDFGGNVVSVNQNGATTVSVSLGAMSRTLASHGALNLTLPVAGVTTFSATNASIPNVNGIIGGWATVGSGSTGSWAVNDGTGNIVALTTFTDVTGAPTIANGATTNVRWSGSTGNATTGAGTNVTTDINSLLFTDTTARTLTVASTNTLRLGSGGIYNYPGPSSTAVPLTIGATGSFLTAGGPTGAPGELVLNGNAFTPDVNGQIVVSVIKDNGTGTGHEVTVVKTGNAAVQLNSTNTYTGGTYINSGRLRVNSSGGYGSGSVYVASGAQAYLGGGTHTNNFFIAGKSFYEGSPAFTSGAIRLASAADIVNGTITLTADARIGARGATATTAAGGTINGQITGNFNLELNRESGSGTAGLTASANTMTLTNSANNWGGSTTIGRGRVRIGGLGEVIPDTSNVVIFGESGSESILTLDSHTETINGLSAVGDLSLAYVTNNTAGVGTLRVGANNATSTYDGRIQDSTGTVAITKIGSGTFTLTGSSNTYSGATTVSAGNLVLASGATLPNSSVITASGTGTFDATAVSPLSLSSTQTIAASGTGLVKGSINLSGTASGNGGTIGTGSDVLTASGGSFLKPGNSTADGSVGTLNLQNLTSSGSNYRVDATGAGDKIVVIGTADFSGGGTITVAPGSVANTYTILTAGTLTGAPSLPVTDFGRSHFALDLATANTVKLVVTGAPAQLRWTGAGADATAWENAQTNANWIRTDGGTTDTTHFYDGDTVTFNDNNSGHYTVNINGTVTPAGTISVANGTNSTYTFGGGGTLGGVGNLVFSSDGTGTLTINTANTSWSGNTSITAGTLNAIGFQSLGTTGTVTLNSGRLNIGNFGALPSGTFTINGGTIDNTSGGAITSSSSNPPIVVAGSFTFVGTNDLNLGTGAVTLNANPTITVSAGKLTIDGSIGNGTGSAITKAGNGTLTLTASNSYSGVTTITAGNLQISPPGNFAAVGSGNITVSGTGTLDLSPLTTASIAGGFGSRTVTISGTGNGGLGAIYSTGAQQINAFQRITLAADATIGGAGGGSNGRYDIRGGAATLDLAGHVLTKSGVSQFTLVAATVNSTGGVPGSIVVNGGELGLETTTVIGPSTVSLITMNANTRLEFFSNTAATSTVTVPVLIAGAGVTIGGGNGSPAAPNIIGSPLTLQNDVTFASITTNAVDLNANRGLTMTGNIGESGSRGVFKDGASTLTLSGTNSYSGGTTVDGGTLVAGSDTAIGTGNIGVFGGATFDLNGHTITAGALKDVTYDPPPGGNPTTSGGTVTNNNATAALLSIGNNNAGGSFSGTINDNTGTVAITKAGSGTQTLAGSNNYSGGTSVNGGILSVSADNNLGNSAGAVTLGAGTLQTTAAFSTARNITATSATSRVDIVGSSNRFEDTGTITVNAASKLSRTGAGTLKASNLSIAGATNAWTGTLDVTNGKVILPNADAGAAATMLSRTTNQLKTGITVNLDWSGTGIVSSTVPTDPDGNKSVGVILNDGGLYGDGTSAPLWRGQSVTSTDVLVAFTYAGDADLNGLIDGIDYALTDNGFNSNLSGWFNGDFDYNGVVDGIDYALLDNAFNTQGAPLAGGGSAPAAVTPVPEPSAIVLVAIGVGGVGFAAARRRRRDAC